MLFVIDIYFFCRVASLDVEVFDALMLVKVTVGFYSLIFDVLWVVNSDVGCLCFIAEIGP